MGTKLRCLKCNDIIEGDRKGHLISCSCEACYIDETPDYYRVGGDPQFINIIDKDGVEHNLLGDQKEEPKPRRDKINYYLDIAETVAKRSTCLKRHYGCIIVKNDEVIATGYSGAPRGLDSCLKSGKCHRANSDRGTNYESCTSVHAEQNAIISASRNEMIDADLYLVGRECNNNEELDYVKDPSPCCLCKRMIINAGIKSVFVRIDDTRYDVVAVRDWNEKDIVGGY